MKNPPFSVRSCAAAVALSLAFAILPHSASAITGTWTRTADGTYAWSGAGNFTGGTPQATGDIALINTNLAGPAGQTINLDIAVVLGALTLGDSASTFFPINIAGPNTLTFNNSGAGATLTHSVSTATDTISAAVVLADNLTLAVNTGTVTFSGGITGTGNLNKTSAGRVILTGTNNFAGNVSVAAGALQINGPSALAATSAVTLSGGTLDLRSDGDGTDGGSNFVSGTAIRTQAINFGQNVTVSASSTIQADRLGTTYAPLFTTAANKTMQLGTLTIGAQTLTITNNNGYGVEFTGTATLTAAANFSVTTASVSTAVPGLTLSGVVAGTNGFTKSGAGTLLLTNSGNTVSGSILVTGGVLGATNNGALGGASTITIGSGASSTFQAFDTFTATGRGFVLGNTTNTNNNIGVSQGKTLTLDTAFAGTATNGFQKVDAGTLVLGVDNATRSGVTTVSGGVLQLTTNDGTGSGAITVTGVIGNALHLSGGISEASALTLNNTGVNSNGALYSLSGSNTVTGAVTLGAATTVGAASTATLNINNNTTGAFALTVAGEGTVNLNGTFANNLLTARSTNTAGPTVVVGANNALTAASTLTINGGTLTIGNGTGTGSLTTAGTGAIAVNVGGVLTINNAGANINSRAINGSRAVTLQAGTLNYTGNGAIASSETTTGLLTVGVGQSTINITGGTVGNAATLTFGGLTGNVVNVGGFLKITGLDANNSLVFTAATTGDNGVVRRAAIVNGANASLVSAAAGTVTAATLTGASGDLNNQTGATGPGGTFAATNNAQLSAGTHYIAGPNAVAGSTTTASTTVNALVMDSGSATTLTGTSSQVLTVTSGNILIAGNTNAVMGNSASPNNGIVLAQGTTPTSFMVNTGSTLELAATITTGTNTGLQKALEGSMDITGKQFFSTGSGIFDIVGGTVKLAAGNHTLAAQQVNVAIGPNAILDLNGTVLETNALTSSNASAVAGSGGTITNTAGTQATLVVRNGGNWGGQITGDVFVGATQSRVVSNDNTYTGGTFIAGGTTTLQDLGKISGTTSINIYGGTLAINNSGTVNDSNRVNDAAGITLRTGTISFTGRDNTASTELLGAVTLAEGASQITITNGTNGTRSADLTLTSLTRSNTDATLNMNNMTADIGNTARLLINTAPTLSNNIIGGWATIGGAEFASYSATYGVAALNSAGMAGYDRTLGAATTLNGLAATENVKVNAGNYNTTLGDVGGVGTAGNITLNSMIWNGNGAGNSLVFQDSADKLYVASGGFLRGNTGNVATSIGTAVDNGQIAAGEVGATGVQTLYFQVLGNNNAAAITTLNSRITDNSATAATRLVFTLYNQGIITMANGNNDYTGGTVLNGWTGTTGNSAAGTINASAVGTISTGGLTINNALLNATVAGAINAANDVTLNMGAGLNLTGSNTLNSLTLNATGFSGSANGAPAVNIGGATSVLTLTNATVTASSNNATGVGTALITGTAGSQLNFGGQTAIFNVDGIKQNGVIIDPWVATLQVGANVAIVNANGLTKTGDGVLMLSGPNTFTGGVNLTTGGLMIGASSTTSARTLADVQPVVTAGPLGTGTLTIGGGTRILSSAAGNTVGNQVTVAGNFEFDGTVNVTLNGNVDLSGATRTISVNTPQMTATLGGVISNGGIVKDGYGTLILNNANTFTGGVTINNGTLVGQIPGSASASGSPFGTGDITYNGGILSVRSVSGDAVFGNNINVNALLEYVNLDVQGGNMITMGSLNLPVTGGPQVTQVNVTGSTGSTLRFTGTTLSANGTPASTTRAVGAYQTFNIATGVTTILMDSYSRNNEPLNIGAGNLILGGANTFSNGTTITTNGNGAAPLVNATTAIYGAGQTVTLTGGTTGSPIVYSILPQTNTVIGGNATGGLQQSATNVASGQLNVAANWGLGATSIFNGDLPNDAAFDRVLHTNAAISTLGIYNGYLNITTAGTYEFLVGSDDYSSLVIDGVEVTRDITAGHAVQDTARGSIFLSAGQHTITMKINTGTGTAGGGGRLLYSGPDTAANGTVNNWQALDPSKLSYFTGPANASNNYYNAAQIDNDYALTTGSVFTFQGLGTDYNSTIKSLTMAAGSQLNVTNDQGTTGVGGTGFIGVKGETTITGAGAVVSPTTGSLYLIGGVNDGGLGLTKQGNGSLNLNNSTSFTGTFAINLGTVIIRETDALSTGANVVASGASIDLFGVGSSAGRNVTINGAGTASQIGAIYNSQAATATFAGNVNLATSSQVAGYGDIIISGTVTSAAGATFTKAGSDTLTLTNNNTATMLGPVVISGGILNNGLLNAGTIGALGVGAITANAGTVLNLNGNNLSQNITLNGTAINTSGPNGATLGNLINSSISNSVAIKNAVTPGDNMMQLANTAATATVNGNITLNTAVTGIGSNTFSAGGDIIINGAVSGGQTLQKVGGDTVYLRGTNSYTGGTNVNWGTLVIDGAGVLNGAGGRIQVDEAAVFTISNATTFTNNRINNGNTANNKNLLLRGGTLNVIGSASIANDTTELFSASVTGGNTNGIDISQGHNNINLNATGGAVTVTATRAGSGVDFTNISFATTTATNNGATVLIVGNRLGLDNVGTDGSTNLVLTNAATAGAALNMVGQNSNTALGGSGTSKGIAPYALVDDGITVDFATLDSAARGVRALATATERTAANVLTGNTNALITASTNSTVNATLSLNSLKLTGGSLNLLQGSNLNIQSGGILATANATIGGPGIISVDGTPNASGTSGAQNLYLWAHGGSTVLTINAAIGSAQNNTGRVNEIIKAGTGTVVLGGSNFTVTNTRVQEGTLQLNNANAIFYRLTTPAGAPVNSGSNVGPTLQVNYGGTLDMNGFDLTVNNLNSINPSGNTGSLSGGTIINTLAGTKTLAINTTGSNTWSGNISGGTGAINFSRYGRDTFTVTNSNTYTGATILAGGLTTFTDLGAFRNTSSVTINQAALSWSDAGTQSDAYRLGATPASVTFNGGGFSYTGRSGESSVANLGAVLLNSGASQFTTNAAALGSATVQVTSFTRSVGATVNFAGSTLGDDGYVKVTGTAPTNYNGIVGGWAITSSTNPYNYRGTVGQAGDFVTYDPVTGFRAIVDYQTTGGITLSSGNSNQPALGNTIFTAGNNIRVNNNTTMLAGNNVVNSMVLGIDNAGITLSYASTADTLYVQSGGVLADSSAQTKTLGASVATSGKITAGNADGSAGAGNAGYELFLHNISGSSNSFNINAQIVDNGANAVSLVTSTGTQNGPVIRLNNTNTYSGTTTINSTDLRLNSAVGPAIANSLNIIVNGGTENAADSGRQVNGRIFFEQSNQLNVGATVTLDSGVAGLDLNNFNQTLANLTFENIGGHSANSSGVGPTVRTGSGTLTLTGNVTATNISNTSTIANIAGNLALTAGQHNFSVDLNSNAASQIGLSVNGTISGAGGINKTGDGVLALVGTSTYTGDTNVQTGTLVLAGVREDGSTDGTAILANTRINVSSGATVDMRGGNAIVGSLDGAGTITNSVLGIINNTSNGNPGTLTIGADNTSTGNFSGRFTNFMNGANETSGFNLNITKIGTGTQTISGDNAVAIVQATSAGDINNVGTLDIQEGTIRVAGASGSLGFTTINIKQGATLVVDDATDNKANRLGGYRVTDSATNDVANDATTARTINMQGGTIRFLEGAALINEGTAGTLALATNAGAPSVSLNAGVSTWVFDTTAGNAGATINLGALSAGGGSLFIDVGNTQTLGRTIAGTNSINIYVNGGMTSQGTGPLQATGTAVAAAAGVQGNIVGGIRADVTATDSTGTGFVTYDRYGYRLLTATEYSAFPVQPDSPLTNGSAATASNPPGNWAAVNPTVGATYTGNALVTETQNFTTNTTVASLRLDDGGSVVSMGGSVSPASSTNGLNFNALGTLNTLTVSSGAIIANANNNGFTGGAVSSGGAALRFTTATAAALEVDSYLISTNTGFSIVKDGAGELNLNKQVFIGSSTDVGQLIVNAGTVNLRAGHNTLTAIHTAGVALVDNLTINPGGIVDLNGFDQAIAGLVSTDPNPGSGGTITSATSANLFVINADNTSSFFGGSIDGAINLYIAKAQGTNNANEVLTSTNGYTGTTTVTGGTLIVRDGGELTATSAVNLNQAQLTLENGNLSSDANRLVDSAAINLRGGTLALTGRPGETVTETLGAINLINGNITIAAGAGGTSGGTILTTGAITRSAGSNVNFTNNSIGTLGGTNAANQGANPRIFITGQANGLIGGWAVVNGTNFATYDSVLGVGELGNTGSGFAGYDSTNISTSTISQTVNDGTTKTITTNIQALAWRIAPGQAATFTLGTASGAGNSLILANGGLLTNNNAATIIDEAATQSTRSTITSGGTRELDIFVNQNTTTLGLQIINDAAGSTSVVKGGAGTLTLTNKASNTYTGTTYVNAGTLNLNAGAGIVAVPGDLVVNNATVTMTTNAGQIATSSNVTMMGSGTLTFGGAAAAINTIQSLTFNNNGGRTNPSVAIGTGLFLNIGGGTINAIGDNPGTVSTISGGTLNFGTSAPVLNVTTNLPNKVTADLLISSVIANDATNWTSASGALTKTGNGNLVLTGANTFTNGFTLSGGTLTLGASSTPTSGAVTSGPLGTGTFTIGGGTTIMSDSTVRTLANNVVVTGDFTFGGEQAGNNLILNGTVNLGAANRTITVTNPTVTATLGGIVSGSVGLTKNGNGILALNAANNYTGSTTINGGLVTAGNVLALGANTNDLAVGRDGTLNVNGLSITVDGLSGDDATHGGLITNSTGTAVTLTLGNNNEATATYAGTITNAAGALTVTKVGTGTQVLTGTNTYTGATNVNGGVLQVGDAASGNQATLGSGNVTVNTGGKLAGTGHVLGIAAGSTMTIASGGVLAPGDVAGASNGTLTLGSVTGSGLAPLAVNAGSPTTVAGPVNLTVSAGGTIQLGITAAALNDGGVVNFATAADYFATLSTTDKQRWDGQGWTQTANGLVGSTTVTLASLGLGVSSTGNGGIYVGQLVSGDGIQAGTTVTGITGATVTLSNALTSTSSSISFGTTVQNVTLIAGSSTVTVASATGLVIGQTVSGFGIQAGTTIANLVGNTVTLSSVALASTNAPTVNFIQPGSYDHLNISGTLTLGATVTGTVSIIDNGYLASANAGDVFNLLDWSTMTIPGGFTIASTQSTGGLNGNLDLPTLGTTVSGVQLYWDTSLFTSRGILVVVPEPSRALMLFFGVAVALLRRRRR